METTFKLQDTDGNAFRIKIIFPWFGTLDDGTWQALDHGYVSAIGGSINASRTPKNITRWNLRLLSPNGSSGQYIMLRNAWGLYGWSSVGFADAGGGTVRGLSLAFKEGDFSWIKL